MSHRVGDALTALDAGIANLPGFRGGPDLRLASGHRREAAVQVADVLPEPRGRVPLRIDRHEEGPNARPERVHTRTQLLDQVWGDQVYIEERTVDVHIRRLRLALGPHGCDAMIETVRGTGYRLAAPH